jgi:hypothetical protein
MGRFQEPSPFYAFTREGGAELDSSRPTSIQIAFQEYYGAIPDEVWELTVSSTPWAKEIPSIHERTDRWLAEATQLNVYPDSPRLGGSYGPLVELHRKRSNDRQVIIIPMPSELIAPEKRQVTYDRLGVLFTELWRRAGSLGGEVAIAPVDVTAAEIEAKAHLLTVYGNELRGESRFIDGGRDIRSGTWSIIFVDLEGTRYEVTLEAVKSIPSSCRVRKNV